MAEYGDLPGAAAVDGLAWLRKAWWVVALVGLGVIALGIVMLVNAATTTTVLAVLVGIYLIIWGIVGVAEAHRATASVAAYALALVLIAGGVIVAVWPHASLHVLAVIIGITLIVAGCVRLGAGFAAPKGSKGVLVLFGAVSLAIGLILVVWPHISLVIIGIVVGIRALITGIELVIAGIAMRRLLPTS